jgi:hypothetical protein
MSALLFYNIEEGKKNLLAASSVVYGKEMLMEAYIYKSGQ